MRFSLILESKRNEACKSCLYLINAEKLELLNTFNWLLPVWIIKTTSRQPGDKYSDGQLKNSRQDPFKAVSNWTYKCNSSFIL